MSTKARKSKNKIIGTFPLQSTGSTDEYETDDYSPNEDSSSDDDNDDNNNNNGGGRGVAIGTSGRNKRRNGNKTSIGTNSSAKSKSAGSSNGKKSNNSSSSTTRSSKRGGKSSEEVELLSSDDDADSYNGDSEMNTKKKSGKSAAVKKSSTSMESDDEYKTDSNNDSMEKEEEEEEEEDVSSNKSSNNGLASGKSKGRRALGHIKNDNKSNTVKSEGNNNNNGNNDTEEDDAASNDDDSDDDDSDDPFGGLGRRTTTKRQKVSNKDSDDSDSDDSDDSMHLGRNRSAELAERRKRLMAKESTFSSSDSDDSDSSSGKKNKKPAAKKTSSAKATAAKKKPASTSDDSDSSISFLGTQPRKNPGRKARSPQKKPAKKCSPAKKSSAAAAAGGKRKSMGDDCEILSSDDDIDLPQMTSTAAAGRKRRSPRKQAPLLEDTEHHDPSVRKASTKALDNARQAREALRAAQQYKAKEVEMPAVDLDIPKSSSSRWGDNHGTTGVSHTEVVDIDEMITSKPAAEKAAPTVRYTGPTIRLTLRYKTPTTNKFTETNMKIKMDQPIQHLVDEFNTKESSSCLQIASVKFDGQTLDLTKTPSFYEMEDEDMVDVVVVLKQRQGSSTSLFGALGSMASRAAATMGVGGGSSTVTQSAAVAMTEIHVQTKGQPSQKHNFKLNAMDPLSKVVKAYCEKYQLISLRLEYNGRLLDPKKSPHAEGLPNVVHLDAVGEVGGPSIKLRFRVNGKANDITMLSIPLKGQFQSVMARFAQKKCVTVSQCKFIFDGEVLNPNATPEGLDLEGDEMIDVKLPESNASSQQSASSITSGAASNRAAQTRAPSGPPANISIQTNRNVSSHNRFDCICLQTSDSLTNISFFHYLILHAPS